MPNILINPSSGILEFNTGAAGGALFDASLSGASRLTFNSGELNLVSYSTGVKDRFTIDGSMGRLFAISDILTGTIFSVNDIAGLPLIEVVSTTGDTITIGPYNTNTFVVKDTNVGIGTGAPSSNLEVYGPVKIASARNNQFPLTIYGGNSSAQACHVLLYNNVTRGVLKAGGNGLDGQGFADSSYNYLLFVSGNGNVGVGTTSPFYKLDVDGSGNFRSGLYSNGVSVLTDSSNAVFRTGDQSISGVKTFNNGLNITGRVNISYLETGIASPILNIEQTWITGNPTGIKLNIIDSGSGPSGILLDLQLGGVSKFRIDKNGSDGFQLSGKNQVFTLANWNESSSGGKKHFYVFNGNAAIGAVNTMYFGINDAIGYGARIIANNALVPGCVAVATHNTNCFNATTSLMGIPGELRMGSDAAGYCGFNGFVHLVALDNTLEQRKTTNPQIYNIYNTYTNSANFERAKVGWTSNVLEIGTEQGSTGGLPRNLALITSGQKRVTVTSDGKVGIGTSTPSNKLDVIGSAYISGGIQAANQTLIVENGNVSIFDSVVDQYSFDLNNATNFTLLGNSGAQIELYNNSLITGFKNISATNIYKSGYPVLTTNDTGSFAVDTTKVVFTTGNQTIIGNKTFSGDFKASSLLIEPGSFTVYDNVFDGPVISLIEGNNFVIGAGNTQIDIYNQTITGFAIYSSDIYKDGYPVLTTNDTGSFAVDTSKIVFTTGNQTVNGEKTLINNLNLQSGIKFNGGISSGNLEIYKNDKTYNFSVGPTGTWGNFGSTLISLTSGGPNISNNFTPSFKLIDQSNSMLFEIGGYSDDAQYGAFNTFRMGDQGFAYWGNGGIFAVRGANVGIGTDLPNYKLDVAGDTNIVGNINATSFSSSGNAGLTTSVSVIDNSNNVITLNFENGLLISVT